MKKKILFLYYPGARGDFLASILVGNILAIEWNNPWIVQIGGNPRWCKMHQIGDFYNPSGEPFTAFTDFTVVRIKLESESDYLQCKKLVEFKMTDFLTYASIIKDHEEYFSKFDNNFDYVVPFRDLFDIDKLEELFFKFRNRRFSDVEKQRITHNIRLQNNILNTT